MQRSDRFLIILSILLSAMATVCIVALLAPATPTQTTVEEVLQCQTPLLTAGQVTALELDGFTPTPPSSTVQLMPGTKLDAYPQLTLSGPLHLESQRFVWVSTSQFGAGWIYQDCLRSN